jgi:hypothetical protein
VQIRHGATPELPILVKAPAGWRTGATLREIEHMAPLHQNQRAG